MSATRSGTETIPNSFLFPIPNIPNIPSIPVGSESQCPTGLGAPSDAVGAEEVSWPGGQPCVCAQGVSKVPASGGCAALRCVIWRRARKNLSHILFFLISSDPVGVWDSTRSPCPSLSFRNNLWRKCAQMDEFRSHHIRCALQAAPWRKTDDDDKKILFWVVMVDRRVWMLLLSDVV